MSGVGSEPGGLLAASDAYASWVGRERSYVDEMDPGPSTRLWRTLNSSRSASVGEQLPQGWHWLHFLPQAQQANLGSDGHERRGEFLPPIPAPRRMFAGGRMRFHQPLILGARATLTERIASIRQKSGRDGPLVFVTLERHIVQREQLAIEEAQTIVYREAARSGASSSSDVPCEREPQWRVEMRVDPTLLFRFSALTFNAHRIHYDREYCRDVEGYPGLVVHGPLIALLLLESVRERTAGRQFSAFEFRGLRPAFESEPFFLCGRIDGAAVTLWAQHAGGSSLMEAQGQLE